jgi:hypothetical protein
MSKGNPKLRLPLYAIVAASLGLIAFIVFVLQLNEPLVRWAELFISRYLR